MNWVSGRPHPKNVPGQFYVEHGCCLDCKVWKQVAPQFFGWDGSHCYVSKQPDTESDLAVMRQAIHAADLDCIRYRGYNIRFLEWMKRENVLGQADFPEALAEGEMNSGGSRVAAPHPAPLPVKDGERGPPVISVRGADKVFANGTRALEPIDLDIKPGEFITLLGPSGCGKSTLLKMIANLLEPSGGSISWWGQGFDHVGEDGKKLVFVFQDATLMPWARVRGNVRLPLDLAGMERKEADSRVDQALALVGLSKFDTSYPRQLSGGMQMRASIARALVTAPNMLLMDEPFGALDEITRNRLDQDLLDLWHTRGLTVVFVTHSIYEAVFLSTRVVVMAARPGRILREVAIDAPYPRNDAFRVSQQFAMYARDLQLLLAEASAAGAVED